jgi:DNA invertase Pin-like site-specific DNA recombinase
VPIGGEVGWTVRPGVSESQAALIASPLDSALVGAALAGAIGDGTVGVGRVRRWRPRTAPDAAPRPAARRLRARRRPGWPGTAGREDAPEPAWVGPDRRRASRLAPGSPLIGYVTVRSDSRSSDAVRPWAAIEARCERFGWDLLEIVNDRDIGRIRQRPGLRYALERIVEREADGLVISDLHLLSRSIVDIGALLAWFRDAHATLIALDLNVDTSTPEGDQVASTLIALANFEHERIASRTRNGLAKVRGAGAANGRPAVSDRPELTERIAAMRAQKMTLQAIADQRNAEGVPTLRGGAKWRPSSIQATLGYRRPGPRDRLPPLKRVRP